MTNNTVKTVIDINHPYYFSSASHPGLSLNTEVLNDKTMHTGVDLLIALSAKLKLDFIDGTQLKPADTTPHVALRQCSDNFLDSQLYFSLY